MVRIEIEEIESFLQTIQSRDNLEAQKNKLIAKLEEIK
jgi:hypothetical protein